jgi:hypothetical protein
MSALPSLFDIFFVIVLIIPGFLAWQWARFVCNEIERERKKLGEPEKFSNFDITVYSLCFTLPIVAIFSFVTGIQSIDALRDNIFDPINLLILVILAIFCGTVFGFGIIAYDKYFKPKNDEPVSTEKYLVKEANNLIDAKQLIAQGYEYAADFDGTKLFRKRK